MQNRLRVIRDSRELSQQQLADMVGVTSATISKLELSQRRLSTQWIARLSKALQCHPLELIEDAVPAVTNEEKAVLELFRGLAEPDRRAFLQIAASLPKSTEPQREHGSGDDSLPPSKTAA